VATFLESDTATQLVFTVEDLPRDLPARFFIAHLMSLIVSIELAIAVACEEDRDRKGPTPLGPTSDLIRVRSLKYGSPVELVVDLEPIMEFLSTAGWIAFLALLTKLFSDVGSIWKTFEEAGKARLERQKLRLELKLLKENRSARAGQYDPLPEFDREIARLNKKAEDTISEAIASLVEAVSSSLPESMNVGERARIRIGAQIAARRYINGHDEEVTVAGESLRGKHIRIDLK
jgi:hypothetical protein